MNAEGPAIRTEALTRRFGRITTLDGLSIEVAGEVFGLLGPARCPGASCWPRACCTVRRCCSSMSRR